MQQQQLQQQQQQQEEELQLALHRSTSSPICVERRSRSPVTTTTSLASAGDVGQLLDVGCEDQELPSFEPLNHEDRLKLVPNAAINEQLILARFDDDEEGGENSLSLIHI